MVHLGIIGGGNISVTHARAANQIEGLKIAAIYGSNSEKCAALSTERFRLDPYVADARTTPGPASFR